VRIHVVCLRPHADRILPRKARYLSDHNQWTVSELPDPTSDAQLWLNYLVWDKHRDWDRTKQAAYFTHWDEQNEKKAQIWDDCAKAMDLRITTAKRNLPYLEKYGKTTLARPPVERERFRIYPQQKWKDARPKVGVCGYTYGDKRKGEHLIRALQRSKVGQRLALRASGRGWPVKTTGYPWAEMPDFFQSLDVLLLPSMFEGVPMPPLEALACGIKIVVPRDVGIMDELPYIPGIYRYDRGDIDQFISATEEAAFSDPVDRRALRAVTEEFTPYNWAKDIEHAIEELVYGVDRQGELPRWEEASGIYMVAFGEPSRRCAERALGALKEHMPYVPTCLAAETPLDAPTVFREYVCPDIGGRTAKLAAYDMAPADWQYVLYMDADTEVTESVRFLFQVLADGWEIVICRDMNKYCTLDMMRRPDNIDECEETWKMVGTLAAFQYNGGVFGFRRCERVKRFFELWNEEWQKYAKRDQGALIRALYRQPLRVFLLHNQWNATDRYELPRGKIAVLHRNTEARRWSGLIDARTDSKTAWEAVEQWERLHPDDRPKL